MSRQDFIVPRKDFEEGKPTGQQAHITPSTKVGTCALSTDAGVAEKGCVREASLAAAQK